MGKKYLWLPMIVALLVLVGLGEISCVSSKPVVKDFFTAANNGDFDEVKYLINDGSQPDLITTWALEELKGNIQKLEIISEQSEDYKVEKTTGRFAWDVVKLTLGSGPYSDSSIWRQGENKIVIKLGIDLQGKYRPSQWVILDVYRSP